jgi:hypothetical protein
MPVFCSVARLVAQFFRRNKHKLRLSDPRADPGLLEYLRHSDPCGRKGILSARTYFHREPPTAAAH